MIIYFISFLTEDHRILCPTSCCSSLIQQQQNSQEKMKELFHSNIHFSLQNCDCNEQWLIAEVDRLTDLRRASISHESLSQAFKYWSLTHLFCHRIVNAIDKCSMNDWRRWEFKVKLLIDLDLNLTDWLTDWLTLEYFSSIEYI